MSRFDDIAVNMGFEDLEDLKRNSEPDVDDQYWDYRSYLFKHKPEIYQNPLQTNCKSVILDTHNKSKEKVMESWHTNLPEENRENVAKAIIERLKGQGYQHRGFLLDCYLGSGLLWWDKEENDGRLTSGGQSKLSELIPWHTVLTEGVPKPAEIKAYRITNPNDEDVFTAVQKRFFAGGVGYALTRFDLNTEPKNTYFDLNADCIRNYEPYPESEIKTIPYHQFLEEGIPGVLPTKEEYETEKEKKKWESMKGKWAYFRENDKEEWTIRQFHSKKHNLYYIMGMDGNESGMTNQCKPVPRETIESMIWEGES